MKEIIINNKKRKKSNWRRIWWRIWNLSNYSKLYGISSYNIMQKSYFELVKKNNTDPLTREKLIADMLIDDEDHRKNNYWI